MRFTAEERADPAMKKPIQQAEKAADQLDVAREKLQTKKKLTVQRAVHGAREYLLEVRQNAESVQTCMQVLISSIDAVLEVVDDCDDEDDVDPFDMEDDDE